MTEPHANNLLYFECVSMKALYETMRNWQDSNQKNFLSLNIQQDNGNFCCIALIHPLDFLQQEQKLNYRDEMARFQRKALKHIGVGVSFDSSIISPEKILAIQAKLKTCKTPTEIQSVFREEF